MALVEELKRRKVFKVGGAYLVLAWLGVQVASTVLPIFGAPVWVLRVLILVIAFAGRGIAGLLTDLRDMMQRLTGRKAAPPEHAHG